MSNTNTQFPSHNEIAKEIRNIVAFYPSLPQFVKTNIESNLDFEGMHNIEGLEIIIADLPSLFSDTNLVDKYDLLRDLATYAINIPTPSEYMDAGVL